jgi:hypothetical protein
MYINLLFNTYFRNGSILSTPLTLVYLAAVAISSANQVGKLHLLILLRIIIIVAVCLVTAATSNAFPNFSV